MGNHKSTGEGGGTTSSSPFISIFLLVRGHCDHILTQGAEVGSGPGGI
jgi:hypothetical protein